MRIALIRILPPGVVALILLPHLLCLGISPSEFRWSALRTMLYWIPILGYLRSLRYGRWLYLSSAAILGLLAIVQGLHVIHIGTMLNLGSLQALLETNSGEAGEYASAWWTLGATAICSYVVFVLSAEMYSLYKPKSTTSSSTASTASKSKTDLLLQAYVAGFLAFVFVDVGIKQSRKTLPPTIALLWEYQQDAADYAALVNARRNDIQQLAIHQHNPAQKSVTIVILGESSNRNHWQLYGYDRPTTPLLSAREDIIVFRDVTSGYAQTVPSIKTLLSNVTDVEQRDLAGTWTIFDVARQLGIQTFWLSNQQRRGAWNNATTVLAEQSDVIEFVNESGLENHPDGELLLPLQKALTAANDHKLIIMHTMGSHVNYASRVPQGFHQFRGAITQPNSSIIAAYDNTILYTDWLINEVIASSERHSTTDTVVSVLYVADHGEDVYDSQDYYGHDSHRLSYHLFAIPMVAYLSPEYRAAIPSVTQAVAMHTDVTMTSRNFEQVLGYIMGVRGAEIKDQWAVSPPRSVYRTSYEQLLLRSDSTVPE